MAGFLPPVVATLVADTKEYTAKMAQAQGQMDKFAASGATAGSRVAAGLGKAATAVAAAGLVIGGYAVDRALKFEEALNQIRNQSGASAAEVARLKTAILSISDATTVSTTDLAAAALQIEQAGLRGARAVTLLNDAAKASVITNTSVTDATTALVAAMNLHIARGMDVTKLTGVLVQGAKDFTGGLAAEEKMLSGRVGVALANYGLHLKDVIALGAEFSRVHLPARSIASFTTGLAHIEKPLKDSKGHFTTYAKNLAMLGINVDNLQSSLRRGNIVGILDQVNSAFQKGGGQLATYVNAVFGSSGGAAASVLIKNIAEVKKVQDSIAGAGAGTLNAAFGLRQGQIDQQLKQLKVQAENALTGVGLMLLPTVRDLAGFAETAVRFFRAHPILGEIASGAAITAFAAAVAYKIGKGLYDAFQTVKGLFFGTEVAANTVATQANTAALLRAAGASVVGGGETAAGAAGGGSILSRVGTISVLGPVSLVGAGIVGGITLAILTAAKNYTGPVNVGLSRATGRPVMNTPAKGGTLKISPVLRVSRG